MSDDSLFQRGELAFSNCSIPSQRAINTAKISHCSAKGIFTMGESNHDNSWTEIHKNKGVIGSQQTPILTAFSNVLVRSCFFPFICMIAPIQPFIDNAIVNFRLGKFFSIKSQSICKISGEFVSSIMMDTWGSGKVAPVWIENNRIFIQSGLSPNDLVISSDLPTPVPGMALTLPLREGR